MVRHLLVGAIAAVTATAAFAQTGNPNAPDLPHWPRFDDRVPSVLRLAPEPRVIDVPRRAHLALADRAP